jgi:hypothetical protein
VCNWYAAACRKWEQVWLGEQNWCGWGRGRQRERILYKVRWFIFNRATPPPSPSTRGTDPLLPKPTTCESVSKSLRTGRLERELQMEKLSATTCSCIAILWVSLASFAAISLCCFWTSVYFCKRIFRYRLSPDTFGYTLVHCMHLLNEAAAIGSCTHVFLTENNFCG